ncbi:lamin tail domain-containing protein [Candidatus Woesearchaeota archaeon]|nr:lamin tail domain-containing protein [Candidatus Woesearchaeota archaeon]
MKVWMFVFLLLIIPLSFAFVEINEVMYSSADEWIELYNPSPYPINLSGWNLTDSKSIDQITCCGSFDNCSLTINSESYAIITPQESQLYDSFNTTALQICVDDKSIGNGLGNLGDTITIYNNTHNDSITYDGTLGTKGKTLEKRSDNTFGESLIINGTPGMINSIWEMSAEYAFLQISEVLPNPFGEDDAHKPNGEWVELYNNAPQTIDLKGLILKDKDDTNKLIIADNKVEGDTLICSKCYKLIYRDGDTDFSLNSDFDEVRLFHENKLLSSISYSGAIEGMSFSQFEDGVFLTNTSPNKQNFKLENKCEWKLNLELEKAIFTHKDFSFQISAIRNFGLTQNITAIGIITDFFGKTVKTYTPFNERKITTSATKTYSPKLQEGIYQLRFWFENLTCDDQYLQDNNISKMFAINPLYEQTNSSIKITKINVGSDDRVKWGEQFTSKVEIYKGDETKTSVQLWVERNGTKLSEITRVNIMDKYKSYPLTLPIQLTPNCNENIDSGKAELVLSAFNLTTKKEFSISDVDPGVCKDLLAYIKSAKKNLTASSSTSKTSTTTIATKQKLTYDIIELPASVESDNVFRLNVQILNEDQKNSFTIWPYIYRGSKCYSCDGGERDALAKKVSLGSEEAKITEFLVKIDDGTTPGAYKLKVKILKEGRKTTIDLTKDMHIKEKEEIKVESQTSNFSISPLSNTISEINEDSQETSLFQETSTSRNHLTGMVVYESSSVKAQKLIPYFLILTLTLLSLVIVFNRK